MGEAIISRRGGGKLFAVIDVSYPAGAVCTCSNGTRTLKARGTGGHFLFNIPTAGEWTVTAVLGEDTATETINVTERTAYSVELSFVLWLYKAGDECTGVTGGWIHTGDGSLTKHADNMVFYTPYSESYMFTANKIDVTNLATLYFDISFGGNPPPSGRQQFGTSSNKSSFNAKTYANQAARKTYSLDVSSMTTSYYIGGTLSTEDGGNGTCTIYNVWGEYE